MGSFAAPETVTTSAAPAATKKKSGGGILDTLKKGAGHLLSAIDLPRAAAVSAGVELGNEARNLFKGEHNNVSLSSVVHNTQSHLGAGKVIENSGLLGDNRWAKRVAGGVLDAGADPLNAVTFGSGEVAKEGLAKAGEVIGDDAAKAALREGGVDGLRQAVESQSGRKLEDVLSTGLGDLGTVTPEEHVQGVLDELGKNGKGGLGIAGHRTGLGQGLADATTSGLKNNETLQSVRHLINPVAKVEEATGSAGAAEAVNQGLHTAATARREARAGLQSATSEEAMQAALSHAGVDAAAPEAKKVLEDAPGYLTPKQADEAVAAKSHQEFADTLSDEHPSVASKVQQPGFVPLTGTDTFVHPEVAAALKDSISKPPNDYVRAFDKVNSYIKQMTVFGPLNGIQHDVKRTAFNHLQAVMSGGATKVSEWAESHAAMKALAKVTKSGEEITADSLAKQGLEGKAADRALAFYHHIATDNPLYEVTKDYGEGVTGKGSRGALGTRTAQKYAEQDGLLSRGAVFFHALDGGLSPAAAASQTRKALLDFSSEGLTSFERDKLQRAVFFYKFPRRAIPAAVRLAVEHPGEALAASRLGLGASLGHRNKFGSPLGLHLDTPLEAGLGDLNQLVRNPGGFAGENLNPLLGALVDPNKRGITDIVPPLQQATGKASAAFDSSGAGQEGGDPAAVRIASALSGVPVAHLDGVPLPALGAVKGVDYNQQASDKKKATVQANLAAGKAPSVLQGLQLLADKNGVPLAFSLSQSDLLAVLRQKGLLPEPGTQAPTHVLTR